MIVLWWRPSKHFMEWIPCATQRVSHRDHVAAVYRVAVLGAAPHLGSFFEAGDWGSPYMDARYLYVDPLNLLFF